jgi:cystathionine beta-lyase
VKKGMVINMKHDFDLIVDRKNTNSLKYDFGMERKQREDLLPLWVADMDFRLPEAVLEDIHSAVSHGIFGYSEPKEDYFHTLYQWFDINFNFQPEQEWLVKAPGVVFAIALAIKAFTKAKDCILIQQPVYYPFAETILDNDRVLVNNQLTYQNGRYTMDFEDFEQKIIKHNVKLFLLCSPHNPVGRVWTKEELMKVGELCLKHQVLIVSDEIHGDFTYPGHIHTVFSSINQDFAQNTILCTAPSKTFNLAGLQVSNIFIANKALRKSFLKELNASGYSQLNSLGLVACQSAYRNGNQWLVELKEYLLGNLSFLREYLYENIPEIKLVEPEGTYLVWLDCSALNLTYKELEHLIIEKARLWLDGGIIFGKESALFERINIACPRPFIKQALDQLSMAIQTIR